MVGARSGDAIALGDTMVVVIEDVAILRRTVYARRVGAEISSPDRGRKGKRFQAKNIHAARKGAVKGKGKENRGTARSGPAKPGKPGKPGKPERTTTKSKKGNRPKRRRR